MKTYQAIIVVDEGTLAEIAGNNVSDENNQEEFCAIAAIENEFAWLEQSGIKLASLEEVTA